MVYSGQAPPNGLINNIFILILSTLLSSSIKNFQMKSNKINKNSSKNALSHNSTILKDFKKIFWHFFDMKGNQILNNCAVSKCSVITKYHLTSLYSVNCWKRSTPFLKCQRSLWTFRKMNFWLILQPHWIICHWAMVNVQISPSFKPLSLSLSLSVSVSLSLSLSLHISSVVFAEFISIPSIHFSLLMLFICHRTSLSLSTPPLSLLNVFSPLFIYAESGRLRIHCLYPLRWSKTPLPQKSFLDELHLMVRLQFLISKKTGIPLHWHYFLVHSKQYPIYESNESI